MSIGVALLALAVVPGDNTSEQTNVIEGVATPRGTLIGSQVIFIREPADFSRGQGPIFIANIDGSEARQLTPEGQDSVFVGLYKDSSAQWLYYATFDGDKARTIWRMNLDSLEHSAIVTFESRWDHQALAAVSPDAKYLAYADAKGLAIRDLTTGETETALRDSEHCTAVGGCAYAGSRWSGDGRSLLVQQRHYESGVSVIFDPYASTLTVRAVGGSSFGGWSADDKAVCTFGRYDAPTSVYVSQAPDWSTEKLLPQYETIEGNPNHETVSDCEWLDDRHLVVLLAPYGNSPAPRWRTAVLDVRANKIEETASGTLDACCGLHHILDAEAGALVISSFDSASPGQPPISTQPLLVEFLTGKQTPILQQGDVALALMVSSSTEP
jgi:hypothetical protein